MVFNSLKFLIFLPIVSVAFFLFPHKYRWLILLTASFIFYVSFVPVYICVLIFTILVTHFSGVWIGEIKNNKAKKLLLTISILTICLPLIGFKYINFFASNFAAIARVFNQNYATGSMRLILPIGLSFFTLRSLSYVIEVYRGKLKAEKHLGICALYVAFFPQLISGPIERPYNLIPQFYEKQEFDFARVADGIKLMIWGFLKKLVIADRLAFFVNLVYDKPHDYQGVSLIVATVFFSFQIYCDFSGYSDIATGAAQIIGFRTMDNFNRPYSSCSISEFWKRWHISLSTWFRDYLYIPLGGSRINISRWYANLFVTFLISGFWHGANWTFVIWGALNGFYLIFGIIAKNLRNEMIKLIKLDKFPKALKCMQTFVIFSLITFAWIFFRANSINDAAYIITHLFSGIGGFLKNIIVNRASLLSEKMILNPILLDQPVSEFLIAVLFICFMEFIHILQKQGDIRHMFSEKPRWFRWALFYIMICGILFFGEFNQSNFIYSQF